MIRTGNWWKQALNRLGVFHMAKKRGLDTDDIAVWRTVAKRVAPLKAPFNPQADPTPKSSRPTKKRKSETVFQPVPFRVGERAKTNISTSQQPAIITQPASVSPNMDRRNFQRLLKGQMEIDATLDLHGMTTDQAKSQLHRTVARAHKNGLRMLLVITGKGKKTNTDEFNRPRRGVLRDALPDWLRGPGMSHLVLQVSQAHPKHGGKGAFYVYLRRRR